GWMEALFASHPPSQQRVEANRKLADKFGREGEFGKEPYQRATAQLRKDADAYEAHMKAEQALLNQNYDEAVKLANQAIERQPEEAIFYHTKGQALVAQKREEDALK